MSMPIYTGIEWNGFSEYLSELALERAQRNSMPDLTAEILQEERLRGIHQGVWEVIGKLISINRNACSDVINKLYPSKNHIHEFDFENLCDELGGADATRSWLNKFHCSESILNEFSFNCRDYFVVGKVGDKQQQIAFMDGRKIGIIKSLELVFSISKSDAQDVECLIG